MNITARPPAALLLPEHLDLYYDGGWHPPAEASTIEVIAPGSGEALARVSAAGERDVDNAVAAARAGFLVWRDVAPLERGRILREVAAILRREADSLAMLDAADSGNPYSEMRPDALNAAAQVEFFAGLVTEAKGASIPMGPDRINFSVREPLGVVARIIPFNHPLLFCAGKSAAILASGNCVIIKPPEQAPLSALRFAELVGHLFPAGVLNIIPGKHAASVALAAHPGVASTALVGSVEAGRSVMRAAAEQLKPVLLELGGKNALIAFPDADPDAIAQAIVAGMNFGWCGQSCGSTSRAFVHADIYDAVVERLPARIAHFRPGLPTDPATTMGAIISRAQYDRVLRYIAVAQDEGGRLLCGGGRPDDAALAKGLFVEPTIFADVTQDMTIAREEIFGPVAAVLKWRGEAALLRDVNGLDVGLTCSIWTHDLDRALRTAQRVEAGFVWINDTGRHFLGAPFGGYKHSGLGREECLEELLTFTQEKNINIRISPQ